MGTSDLRAVLYREYKLLVRNKVSLVLGIVPPTIYLVLFTTSISNMVPDIRYGNTTVAYQDFVLPAIMVLSMIAGAAATATSIFQEEMGGMTLELWSYPLRKPNYIAGKLAATTTLVCLQGLLMLVVAVLLFGRIWPLSHMAALLVGAICCSLCLNGLYLYGATLIRDQQMFMIAINVAAPFLFFSSPSFYPQEQMASVLRIASMINPLTYGINALRDGLFYGFQASWMTNLLLLGVAILTGIQTSRSLLARFRDL